MKRFLTICFFLFFEIQLYADVIKVVPNFLIKADCGGELCIREKDNKSDIGFNGFGRLTFAIDPFFITDDEEIKKFEEHQRKLEEDKIPIFLSAIVSFISSLKGKIQLV